MLGSLVLQNHLCAGFIMDTAPELSHLHKYVSVLVLLEKSRNVIIFSAGDGVI